MSAAAALLAQAKADFDSKPHRYKLTFLLMALTNGRNVHSFGVLNVRVGFDEPITPDDEERWLSGARQILSDQSVFALGFSKYE